MGIKILLTGYGPFGEIKVNPSWQAVKILSENWASTDELLVKEIPVCYRYVDEHMPLLLKEYQPNLIIHVGAGNPALLNEVHLESCAHSTGYTRLDIEGCCGQTTGTCICLNTDLDIDKLVAECQNCTDGVVDFKKSINAGRYLCEYIYFTSLNVCKEENIKGSALFVHVPPIDDTCTLDVLVSALKMVVELCAKQVHDKLDDQ